MSWLDCALTRSRAARAPGHRPGSNEPQQALGGRVAPSVWLAMAMVRARTCVVDSEKETYDEDTG
jgi:hypothetical protein